MTSSRIILRSSRTATACVAPPLSRGLAVSPSPQAMDAAYSSGSDAANLDPVLAQLTTQKPAHKWQLSPAGDAISRPFKFRTFKAAWAFMNDTAAQCKKERHHPEWSNVYNRVFVRWTTHDPPGLSDKDLTMAKVCDELAARDESKEEDEEPGAEELERLANGIAAFAQDCCAPSGRKEDDVKRANS